MNEMTVKTLIAKGEGYILSEATHRSEDLLSASYDFMKMYEINEELRKEIADVFTSEPTPYNIYYASSIIPAEKRDYANELFNETVYSYFNRLAPDGYYFGTTEGDGSCFGWFKAPEEE